MSIIVTKDDQLIMIVRHHYQHRPNKVWEGCLEIEKGDYSYSDILKLANEDPETIVSVGMLSRGRYFDTTDLVLDYAEANRGV